MVKDQAHVFGDDYSGDDLTLSGSAAIDGNLVTTDAFPGSADESGIERCRVQVLKEGTWDDVIVTGLTNAQPIVETIQRGCEHDESGNVTKRTTAGPGIPST